MVCISEKSALLYPSKHKIQFDKLYDTTGDFGFVEIGGISLPYILTEKRIRIESDIINKEFEPTYFIDCGLCHDDRRLLYLGLITKNSELGYFPYFHAHGFLNMVLDHFSEQIDGIRADWYPQQGRNQIFQEFFAHGGTRNPEKAAMSTTVGMWFYKAGFRTVVPSKDNIYSRDTEGLYFTFYR